MPQIAAFRGTLETKRDDLRALYRYHQVFELGGRPVTRKSIVCAVGLLPWSDRIIRPHEATDPADKAAALAAIEKTKMHATPVWAGFRDAAGEVDRLFRGVDAGAPTLEHRTADGCTHRVFRVQSAEIFGPLHRAFAPKKLHILDGHGRYEAMLAYSEALDAKAPLAMYSTAKYGLMCLSNLDDETVHATTAPRHRVVQGKVDLAAVLGALGERFVIEKLPARDAKTLLAATADSIAHQPVFAFASKAEAYKVTLRPDVALARQGVAINRALQKIDSVVFDAAIKPALGAATIATTLDLEAALRSEDLVIATRALPLIEAIRVDEINELLPPGSTAFVPAIAPRVSFTVEPDQDVK